MKAIVALSAIFLVAHDLRAQAIHKMVADDITFAVRDIGAIWSSPFDARPRDWMMAGGAFAVFGLSMFADEAVDRWAVDNGESRLFRTLKPIRAGGDYSFTGKTIVPAAGALYIAGLAFRNQDLRDAVWGCMASWQAQSLLRKGVYRVFGRRRPQTANGDAQEWQVPGSAADWQLHSFPGGHIANAVACSTFWNKRFSMGVAEPLLYGVAAAVGVGRTADRAHWFSDNLIGAIVGYAVGTEVARRSLDRQVERTGAVNGAASIRSSEQGMSMFASPDGVGLQWRIQF